MRHLLHGGEPRPVARSLETDDVTPSHAKSHFTSGVYRYGPASSASSVLLQLHPCAMGNTVSHRERTVYPTAKGMPRKLQRLLLISIYELTRNSPHEPLRSHEGLRAVVAPNSLQQDRGRGTKRFNRSHRARQSPNPSTRTLPGTIQD